MRHEYYDVIDSFDNVWRSGKAVFVELNQHRQWFVLYLLIIISHTNIGTKIRGKKIAMKRELCSRFSSVGFLLDNVANSSEQALVSEIRDMRAHSSLTKEASPEFAILCKIL